MVATHIYTPNSTPRELPSPCSRLLFVSLMIANPTGVRGNSSGVLASMSGFCVAVNPEGVLLAPGAEPGAGAA